MVFIEGLIAFGFCDRFVFHNLIITYVNINVNRFWYDFVEFFIKPS